jgi:hypothetical protein
MVLTIHGLQLTLFAPQIGQAHSVKLPDFYLEQKEPLLFRAHLTF